MKISFGREGDYAMGIGSVTSTNSMSGMQTITAASTDPEQQTGHRLMQEITLLLTLCKYHKKKIRLPSAHLG